MRYIEINSVRTKQGNWKKGRLKSVCLLSFCFQLCPELSLQREESRLFSEISGAWNSACPVKVLSTAGVPTRHLASEHSSAGGHSVDAADPHSLCSLQPLITSLLDKGKLKRNGVPLVPMASFDQGRVTLKSKWHSLEPALMGLSSLITAGNLGHVPKWSFHLFLCPRSWRPETFVGGSRHGCFSLNSFLSHTKEMALF